MSVQSARSEIVKEDLPLQRREWRVQRVIWIFLCLILMAGLLGLFGRGPISETIAGDPADAFWLQYEKFNRYKSSSVLRVHMRREPDQPFQFQLSNDYLNNIQLEQITPEPERMEAASSHTTFYFAAKGRDDAVATIYFRPHRIGRLDAEAVSGETVRRFSQWVYP